MFILKYEHGKVKIKGKVAPFHAHRGSTGIASLILDLCARCRWVVKITPQLLCLQERMPVPYK
jgi:hypothetical protein